ncbi:hypothetical protein BKA65DRAFT_555221 [Rhexocercosporidium sp. MPI-PUGE-AT-0058]|nr:hypothetical protein BKA65DRAFT_555221 [Rhexocercosporidium sp. MPI-PUGE-AT-0058]
MRETIITPALEAVEYESFNYNNSFGSSSIYRGPPTPAAEAAWTKLTRQHGFEYPEDQIHNLNRSKADHIKHVRPEIGTGYVALLKVFHQLHCLNMVRQYTWFLEPAGDYEKPPFNSEDLVGNRMHIDPRIETLHISHRGQEPGSSAATERSSS